MTYISLRIIFPVILTIYSHLSLAPVIAGWCQYHSRPELEVVVHSSMLEQVSGQLTVN